MMLHEKLIPRQFLLDFKPDCTSPPNKFEIYGTYNLEQHRYLQPPLEGEVLDLSRRSDSVETRKTPSPYNSTSSFGTASPSTNCGSPCNSAQTTTSTTVSEPTVPTLLIPNKQVIRQPSAQDIASFNPLYFSNVKQETMSPPPTLAVPLALFPHSPCIALQQPFSSSLSPATYTNTKLEDQKCINPMSLALDSQNVLYPHNITNPAAIGKATRPFNAYPRDPAMVAANFKAADNMWNKDMDRYSTFRKRALGNLRESNGGQRTITNPKMRRTNHRSTQRNSECEDRTVESSDNDSSIGAEHSNKNDTNNNNNNDGSEPTTNGGVKDDAYYERRRKNNAAAKKSRDRRRIKEDEIAIRAAYLERQNIELMCQIEALKKQLENCKRV